MTNHRKRKRKYGKIYTYKDDATHLIGNKVIASDYYRDLERRNR